MKSGFVGLSTDNTSGVFFDKFLVEPVECYKDEFDPEKIPEYEIKTNRFREDYFSDIGLVWKQHNGENPWIYKQNYF